MITFLRGINVFVLLPFYPIFPPGQFGFEHFSDVLLRAGHALDG